MAAPRPDEQPEGLVLALKIDLEAVVIRSNRYRLGIDAESADQAIQELLHHDLLFGGRCLTCHPHHLCSGTRALGPTAHQAASVHGCCQWIDRTT